MEGLVISVMNFLVSWIFTYTFVFLKAGSPNLAGVPADLWREFLKKTLKELTLYRGAAESA